MVSAEGLGVLFMERRLNPIVPNRMRGRALCPASTSQAEDLCELSVLGQSLLSALNSGDFP